MSASVSLVTGASSGLGLMLAKVLARRGTKLVMAATTADKLQAAADEVRKLGGEVLPIVTNVTDDASVANLVAQTLDKFGRLDAVFHGAGRSTRQAILDTTPADFRELIELNFLGTVRVARATVPELLKTRGSLVLVGSLAGKVGARFYGAYPASKFCVSAYAQQLRLELGDQGLHVLLVCPGPIRRAETGPRYESTAGNIPAEALQPGGGAKTSRLDPEWLCEQMLRACQRRSPELVLPGKARWMFAIGQLWPRLGDWLLKKLT
ncbi:MAG: SDR family NAD(P)-dependent oxidoreductase [Planctomycetaceae bacterium]|nr:SDR family NAD(P)-dependent oxidoreductase [Planctomycetaceae bacterium]